MKLQLYDVAFPFRHVFTIAHGSIDLQENLIVELIDGDHRGYGEGATFNYYGVTQESMRRDLETVRGEIESAEWTRPEELWDALLPKLGHNRFAMCALDQAAHDLWGKRLGKPVYDLWGLSITDKPLPLSNYTIGIDPIEKMVAKMQEFGDWPIFKIKLGTKQDLDIVRALRQHTKATFRVDANTAWSPDETLRNAEVLKTLGVEFIEQPLPADRIEEMPRLLKESALPLIADESCIIEEDVAKCAGKFHGVNIKLTKCGGLTPARRMIDEARQLGLKVMVGCMTESTIGISAIAQLLPLIDYVDMDGAVLLAADVADGVRVERGAAKFPATPGLGVTWWGPAPRSTVTS